MTFNEAIHLLARRTDNLRTLQRRWIGSAVSALFCLAVTAHAARSAEPNIFDEDWRPPQRVPSQVVAPPVAKAPATAPVTPQTNPPAAPPAVVVRPPAEPQPAPPERPKRRQVPALAELQKSRKLMREVYARQLADTSPTGRKSLVNALLKDAATIGDAPADQFVLLSGAVDAAAGSGSIPLCLETSEKLAAVFDVDPLAVKWQAVSRVKLTVDTTLNDNIQAGLAMVDQLVSAEDFNDAVRLSSALASAAVASPTNRVSVQNRHREVAQLKANRDRVLQQVERLKAAPDDPAANQLVGAYFCFEKGDWETGLPMLAAGESPSVRAAATTERASPRDPTSQIAAGDAWWDAAEKDQNKSSRAAMQQRASYWYRNALASGLVAGLNRIRLEKRIEESLRTAEPPPAAPASGSPAVARIRPATWYPTDGLWTRRWTVKGGDTKPDLRVQTYTVFDKGSRVKAFTWNVPFVREADGSLSIDGGHFFQVFSRNGTVIDCREWKTRADYLAGKQPLYIGVFEPK